MPYFTSLEYKNIQSVGNHPVKIQLDRSPNTLIGGPNGAGKSTMLYAFAYSLFGKFPSGAKLADAINSVNKKNLLVTIEFSERGDNYRVVRGEKPKKFEIYKNDELVDQQANSRDQQKMLEIILGMDYKTFTQIVMLNKERYVPFMEMNAAERRKVIEDILGISIFSEMNEVLKVRLKDSQRELANIERQIEVKTTELQGQQRLVNQIQDSMKVASANNQTKIDELKVSIVDLKQQKQDLESQLSKLSTDGHDSIKKQKREFETLAIQFEQKINNAKKNSSFFELNDHCPTCGQDIDDALKHDKKHECDIEVQKIQDVVAEMMVELESVIKQDAHYKDIIEHQQKINTELNSINFEIRSVTSQLNSYLKESTSIDQQEKLDEAVSEYNSLESHISELRQHYTDSDKQNDVLESMKAVLKDDGVKAIIIQEYMALMNRKVNEYLQAMNFYINMTLDENFKETFGAMHKEKFTMNNLSTGQKARVNIAIWLALLEVAAIKNSVVSNVILMDEILENVDSEGVKDVMNLFKEKLSDKNIFLITQRFDEFEDLFRSSIKFKLNQGFTEMCN
jgi:DNA repair exonuclease SbcCD ATPase subunit